MGDGLLVSAATAFLAGIGTGSVVPWPLTFLAALSAGMTIAILAMMRRHPRVGASLVIALFFLVGMMRFVQDHQINSNDISHFIGSEVTLSGRIDDTPQVYPGEKDISVRYTVVAHTVKTDSQSVPVSGKVFVTLRQPAAIALGSYDDSITVTGEVAGLHSFSNPGSVDAVAAWNRQGITARLYGQSAATITAHSEQGLFGAIGDLRKKLTLLFLEVMPPGDAAILNGVLFGGGYRDIPSPVIRDFAATGIIHILSVSGSHIALVTMIMIWLGERLRLRTRVTVLVAAAAMLFYALLAGLTPPVIRAVIMGLIALVALLSERERSGGEALAVAVLIMAAWKPSLLFDISFQLTVSGTAGLVFFYSKIAQRLCFLPRWLSSALAVTIAAQAGMVPFLAYYFTNLPLGSLLSNLIVVPIIEGVIILGLAAALCSLAMVAVAKGILVLASLGIGLAVMLNQGVAAIPGLALYIPPFTLLAGILYYALLSWLAGYVPSIPPLPVIVDRYPWYTSALIALTGAAVLLWSGSPRQTEVHFIDVGQGDASLIITPNRRAVLIDTGGTSGEVSRFDIGERVVVPYLKHYGIRELEFLILTHGHQDHAGGAAAVADRIPVKNVMIAPKEIPLSLKTFLIRQKQSTFISPSPGQVIHLDGVTFAVVHTGEGIKNEASAMIRVTYGQHSFLFTGDVEREQETIAVNQGLMTSTVLKVPHHGARTSSSAAFLRAVRPQHAVISVGAANRFGHPHPEVMQRLAEGGAKMYRTDRQGAIRFTTDGEKLTVVPYR